MSLLRRSIIALWLIALAALGLPGGTASAQPPKFDHDATGYPLRGQHENVRCEACHLRAVFKGTPRDCATCHEPNNERGALQMPARHIQTQRSCDECHTTNGFGGARYDHFDAMPGGCATCHDGIRAPGKGANHIPTTASCDGCHDTNSFLNARALPANHIPFAAGVACGACHQDSNFAVMPSLAAIHANLPGANSSCADCHGAAAASFAIPAAGFAVVGLPANHIPTSQPCEQCHVGAGTGMPSLPVANGAKFSGALMSHAGITTGCASCHTPTPTSFAGIAAIVGMPPTAPMGPNAHIPTQAPCETCHLASLPALPVPASATKTAPGTAFATPAPTTLQIHAGVSSGCSSCHEQNAVWMGVGAYPIAPAALTPGAQYTGFQTRPQSAAGAYNIADAAHPTSGDCAQCHSNTNAFTALDKPANHIPYAAAATCNDCHTGSDFSVQPTLANIHAWAPSTSTNCSQCHGAAAAAFAIPKANFSIVGLPSNHIPTTLSCESCHVGGGSSIAATPVSDGAKFTHSTMNHAGITTGCAACHQPSGAATAFVGITRIVGMPATSPVGAAAHIPSSTSCENCHLASTPTLPMAASATRTAPGTGFATPAPGTAQIHLGVSGGCSNCHDTQAVWMGVGAYPIAPSALSAGASYTGFQTRPTTAAGPYNVADPAHPASGDCGQCHANTNAFTAVDKPANHIPYAATAPCSNCHVGTNFAVQPSVTAIHANAQSTSTNCAQCHGSAAASFAIPAANFSIVGLPANHLPTSSSCEVCHVGAGSSIAATPVVDGARFSGS
ncbi:MAG: hypothetical protein KGO01_19735, partial [Burkholderiales bacterium]|nr:hypothetical protein [Burkholderiales bacterium]